MICTGNRSGNTLRSATQSTPNLMITPIQDCPRFGTEQDGSGFRIAEIVTTDGKHITWPELFDSRAGAIRHLLRAMECRAVACTVQESEAVRLSISLAPRLSTFDYSSKRVMSSPEVDG